MYRGSQKTKCICTESSSRGSCAHQHSCSNDARHSGASGYSSVCQRRPGSTSFLSDPMFRCVQCKIDSNRSGLGRAGVPHKCGRPGSMPHPIERAANNQKPLSRFSRGARVAAEVLRSIMQQPRRVGLQPGHLSVWTARVAAVSPSPRTAAGCVPNASRNNSMACRNIFALTGPSVCVLC